MVTTQGASATQRGGWYYGWNIVAVAILSQCAANGVPFNCMSLFLHPWSVEFHVPISQLLLATLPMMIFMSVSAAVIGSFADRKPARVMLGGGLAGMAVLTLLASFATAAWHIEVIYALLMPIPLVMSTAVVCNAVVSRWFVKRLGLALGITAFGIGLAGVVLPPLAADFLPTVGWRLIWRISAAAVGLIVLPAVLFVMRDRPTAREGLHYLEPVAGAAPRAAHGHGGGKSTGGLRTLDILKNRNFWFVVAVFLAACSLYVGSLNNIAPLALSRGLNAKAGGTLLAAVGLSHVASTLIMGILSDKFGNRIPLVLVAMVTAAGGVVLGIGETLPMLIAGAALVGFAGGIFTVLPAVASAEFGSDNVGRVFGLFTLALPFNSFMATVIARVKEVTGSYTGILMAISVACVVSGLAVLLFMRDGRGGRPTPAEKNAGLQQPDLVV